MLSSLILKLLENMHLLGNILIFVIAVLILLIPFFPLWNGLTSKPKTVYPPTMKTHRKKMQCPKCHKKFNLKNKAAYTAIESCDRHLCPLKTHQLQSLLAASRVHWGLRPPYKSQVTVSDLVGQDGEREIEIPEPVVIMTNRNGDDFVSK